jgi:predicted  nucleic acid-binding Zn-ribbon protein
MQNNSRQEQPELEDLSTVLNMLREIKEDIAQIKTEVQDLNERVRWIESTYEDEVEAAMDATNDINETNGASDSAVPDSQDNPTQGIQEKQRALQNSINKIDANMSAIINVLGNVTSSSLATNVPPFNNK